jgi:hypothetical protein
MGRDLLGVHRTSLDVHLTRRVPHGHVLHGRGVFWVFRFFNLGSLGKVPILHRNNSPITV